MALADAILLSELSLKFPPRNIEYFLKKGNFTCRSADMGSSSPLLTPEEPETSVFNSICHFINSLRTKQHDRIV